MKGIKVTAIFAHKTSAVSAALTTGHARQQQVPANRTRPSCPPLIKACAPCPGQLQCAKDCNISISLLLLLHSPEQALAGLQHLRLCPLQQPTSPTLQRLSDQSQMSMYTRYSFKQAVLVPNQVMHHPDDCLRSANLPSRHFQSAVQRPPRARRQNPAAGVRPE